MSRDSNAAAVDTQILAELVFLRREIVVLCKAVMALAAELGCIDKQARAGVEVNRQQFVALCETVQELKKAVYPFPSPLPPEPEFVCICAHQLECRERERELGWASCAWDCPRHGHITAGS